MASTIVTKNSSTASAVPVSGDLTQGELAVNVTDKRLFTKNSGGTVVELGTNPASLALPNGTTNGVAYLNGSKVVTTGSALTFDGTTLGVGIAGSAWDTLKAVDLGSGGAVYGTAGQGGITANAYYGTSGFVYKATNGASIYQLVADSHRWSTAASGTGGTGITFAEQMRLTSTGLGIGTSSPSGRLHVANTGTAGTTADNLNAFFSSANRNSNVYIIAKNTEGSNLYFGDGDSNTIGALVYDHAGNYLRFDTNAAERMRLDSSGNLGLGVTPSAWETSAALQVVNGYAYTKYGMSRNTYYDGSNYRYIATSAAANYQMSSGAHVWQTATSGTAGNAITFTQAMTLDASGRLGLAVTSPSARFHLDGDIWMDASGATRLKITHTGGGEAQIDASTAALRFATSGTERARFDTSGNLLVGTTSAAVANTNSITLERASTYAYTVVNHSGTANGSKYAYFGYNGSEIGSITQNGTSQVLYNISSDYRLKNDPQPLTGAKEFVMALQPKKWQWWDGSGEGIGFIAHEFMEVAKHSGNGEKDAVDENGNPVYQSIQPSSSEVMANLVALIQEQQAIIEQLKADVAALKGN